VVGFSPSVRRAYGPAPAVEVEDPADVRFGVLLLWTVLRRQFERAAVRLGERILIRYRGMVEREGEPSYHDFKLCVDRPLASGRIDWKAIAKAHDDDVDEVPSESLPLVAPDDIPAASAGERRERQPSAS
jgi:hypothetical protein